MTRAAVPSFPSRVAPAKRIVLSLAKARYVAAAADCVRRHLRRPSARTLQGPPGHPRLPSLVLIPYIHRIAIITLDTWNALPAAEAVDGGDADAS